MTTAHEAGIHSVVPDIFLRPPLLQDDEVTKTSEAEKETLQECLPLLGAISDPTKSPFDFNEFGLPQLRRDDHIEFCHENLSDIPAPFVGLDASRPWLVYWSLLSLYLLGEDVSPFRERVAKTFYPLQNPTGGFGGGHGHLSHLAATYAALLSIALVGGTETYSLIDRKAMWHWLGKLKQVDGGFRICEDGEVDTRGAFCALIVTSLLDLPLELPPDSPARAAGISTFSDGLGPYISRCQTYEGGIASAPGGEAHGAYVFCALGCLGLLGSPRDTFTRYLNIGALTEWLSSRQYAPEGGLGGRTNKLVDGCYSHWIGGCWPLVQAALNGSRGSDDSDAIGVGNLYSAEGLARYILCCCQAPYGGLRDKPSKRADSYHTCYTLTGISNTEHFHFYQRDSGSDQFESAFSWSAVKKDAVRFPLPDGGFDDGTELRSLNPVFAIPHVSVLETRQWFESQSFV